MLIMQEFLQRMNDCSTTEDYRELLHWGFDQVRHTAKVNRNSDFKDPAIAMLIEVYCKCPEAAIVYNGLNIDHMLNPLPAGYTTV